MAREARQIAELRGAARRPAGPGAKPPPARRPGRPTLSNEELLDTALDLFLDHGFERTSIDAIAAAAGMAKRTIYARYADKLTLFKAALRRAIDEWIVPVVALREAECDDLEETLQRIGGMLVANILSPAGIRLLRLTNAEANRMPDIGAYNVALGTQPTLAYLADLFQRRLGNGAGDEDEAALAFLHLVVGGPASTAAWGVALEPAAVDRHTRYCVHLFLHGLLPEPRAGALARPGDGRLASLFDELAAQLESTGERLREGARLARE